MFRTLRGLSVLSHVIPLLVVLPLMGIALIYVLETQELLPDLAEELRGQAVLVAQNAGDDPEIWQDPRQAQLFVMRIAPLLTARVMLLSPEGRVLASSVPSDASQVGQQVNEPNWSSVLSGQVSVRTSYSLDLQAEVADVFVPVIGPSPRVVGVVRLTHRLASVYDRFQRLRYLIAGVLVVGLVLSGAVGWVLALNLERPLRLATLAIDRVARGGERTRIPEQGTEEIRTLARAFNSFQDRLQAFEEARSQLLANLVHELGRPLGALHSAVQALQGGATEDPTLRAELLAGMDEEIGRLRRLLDDLAGLHEQVMGTLKLERRPVALAEWLAQVLAPWREAAKAKSLSWTTDVAGDLPTIRIDPDRLGQALGNLISNAIKYTPPGGAISVAAGLDQKTVWIRVGDTGPGIAPDELARIFTPFYRGQAARRFPQGMGLGLSIARDLVMAHGGQLESQSTPGLGSRFTIRLPLST